MIHSDSFTVTPGKALNDIRFDSYKVNCDKIDYTVSYEESPVLTNGFVVKFETSGELIFGYVINNWFEGAYNLPSFTCSYIYNASTGIFQPVEKSYRFKNVDIKDIQTSDDTEEELVKEYNKYLENYGRRYYPGIHRVENLTERLKEYWYTYFDKEEQVFVFNKTEDMGQPKDNKRYYLTHNYYSNPDEANQKAAELNKIIKK